MIRRALVVVALTSSIGLSALSAAHASPITSITQLNNFREGTKRRRDWAGRL